MVSQAGVSGARFPYEDAGLGELRHDALKLIVGVLFALAFLVLVATAVLIASVGERPAYVAIALAAVAVAVARLVARGVRLASLVLVVGLIGVLSLSVALHPDVAVLATLCVPVLIGTVMLDSRAGFATLVLGGTIVTQVALAQPGLSVAEAVLATFGLGGLVLVFGAVLWRSFYTVLHWSWTSYDGLQRRTAELRERQVELGRLNQSLIRAYEQLKQVSGQLERARQTAEEARRLKSEFAASVSHELRTPLNLIIGLSELMVHPHASASPLPDTYRADVEAIYRNACHISNLIDDVLDLSQVEAHRMGLLKEWVSLHDVVAQAAITVKTLFEHTDLWLEVQIPEDIPPLFVDPVRVRQILINLLNNAVRFTEEGGVTVEARAEQNQVVVDVSDTGVGIPAEDLPGVFQEFWRSGEPKRGRRGTGLGLAVSKRFAELHGGNMWVTSVPGRGSTFSLALPLGEKSVVQESELATPLWQRIEQQTATSPTALLVAPEPEALRVFQRYLDGFQVLAVPDAATVVERTAEMPIQAVIVSTPGRRDSVQRALQRTRETHHGARFPVITCALHTSKTHAQDLGVLDYLVKPVTQPQLQRALRRFGRGLRDLVVVDDDPEMLHLLVRMIGALAPRCQVRTAVDGWQALATMQEEPPQGVLLDLLVPGLDGYRVMEQMRQDSSLAGIPIVVITARGAEDEGLVADALEISQVGGIRVGELMRWIRAGLGVHLPPDRLAHDPAPEGESHESLAWAKTHGPRAIVPVHGREAPSR